MRILQLVSCRGWSSDAYWATRVTCELERRGHDVVLGCRAGTEERVIQQARREGVRQVRTLNFAGGVRPGADVADVRRLAAMFASFDVVHVHRGKEHWLSAVANRLSRRRLPLIRTRHIAQVVRAHAGNRWLYRRETAWVVTVTEAIRRQYLAAGLLQPVQVSTLPGGADIERFRPRAADAALRRRLGGEGATLIGMVGGLRTMKGHGVVIEAARRLTADGVSPRFVFVGQGPMRAKIHERVDAAGLGDRIALAGFVEDLPGVLAALDVALYVPLESDGMSRVVFEILAAARPLVASRVGVVPEVLTDGIDAALVPAGDAEALAARLAMLLGDRAGGQELGQAGRNLVESRYSGARVAEALEARYRELATGTAT